MFEDIRQRNIPNLNVLVAPFVEQLDAANLVRHLFRQDLVSARVLDFNLPVIGHLVE